VLSQLLILKDDSDLTSIPAIIWDKIKDNYSEDRVRYLFLRDDCNL